MTTDHIRKYSFPLAIAAFVCVISLDSFAQTPPEWKPVESALGRTGKLQPDGPMKFAMPRKDLKVTVAGTEIKPGLALGSWTAFSESGDNSMVMGDLVLVEDEVAPVMAKLQAEGIDISALHNHVLHEDRKSTRLNSSHTVISYAVFCLKKKKRKQ